MSALDSTATDFGELLGQTVRLCELIAANTHAGFGLLQEVMFGGAADTYLQALMELSREAITAAQRYGELQFEWALQGY